jgi:hypothetical protein
VTTVTSFIISSAAFKRGEKEGEQAAAMALLG